MSMNGRTAFVAVLLAAGSGVAAQPGSGVEGKPGEVWTFDRLDRIGGHTVTVLGKPRIVDAPGGKAVEFDGVADAL